jgi:hypothetical protein
MNLLSKEVLTGAAALGAGAVAAKVVQKKVIPMIAPTASPLINNLSTLLIGIVTPTIVRGSVGAGLGAGMIAVSVAGLVDPYLSKAGITGYNESYMGDVLMGETGSDVLMGAVDFAAANNDFTGEGAGEMNF